MCEIPNAVQRAESRQGLNAWNSEYTQRQVYGRVRVGPGECARGRDASYSECNPVSHTESVGTTSSRYKIQALSSLSMGLRVHLFAQQTDRTTVCVLGCWQRQIK